MKMGAAERVSPLQGSLSFSPLTHHFVVGFASLCHGSSHDLPLSAAPLHPSTRGACRGPRLRRFRAWQKHTSRSTRNSTYAETTFDLSKTQPGMALSHAFFEVKTNLLKELPAFRGTLECQEVNDTGKC